MKIIQWLRSLLFFISLVLLAILFLPFMILFSFFLPESAYYPMVKKWCQAALWLLRITTGVKYKINGIENLALLFNRPGLIISNHQSTFETFLLPTLFPRYCFVLKKELLKIPLFGHGLRRLNPIAIDRSQGKRAITHMMESIKRRSEENIPIIIFPEGTRVPPDRSIPFKNGAFAIAHKLQLSILPISHNAGFAWGKGKLLKNKGTIEITIGELISPEGKTIEELNQITHSWIDAHKSNKLAE